MTWTDEILAEARTLGSKAGADDYDSSLWDDIHADRMIGHFDREGRQISFRDWVRLRLWSEEHDDKYVRVAEDTIGPYWVSTVWIGLNHSFRDDMPPLIFETMVFNHETSETDVDEMERYSTENEALDGHNRIVERVRILYEATKEIEGEL